jgi:hypothetical protein
MLYNNACYHRRDTYWWVQYIDVMLELMDGMNIMF